MAVLAFLQIETPSRLPASPDEVVGVLDTGPDATNFEFVDEVTEGMPVFREGSTDVIGRVKKNLILSQLESQKFWKTKTWHGTL